MADGPETTWDLVRGTMWPALEAERRELAKLDKWYRGNNVAPPRPSSATAEYKGLADNAATPWLSLVVTAVAQALYVDGYRAERAGEDARPWEYWQRNRLDSRQIATHRATLAYGTSYMRGLPGVDPLTGAPMPVLRGIDPSRGTAFYNDLAGDEWPAYFLHLEPNTKPGRKGWVVKFYDALEVVTFYSDANMTEHEWITTEEHGVGVCPIVRFTNTLDLLGRSTGEVGPFIPLASRIDQTVFDRLVVQRFASWKVRTIAGMAPPDPTKGETEAAAKLRLKVEDILIASDPDTKFGTLDASDLTGFIAAKDADIRDLAAVSQTPPHFLLGSLVNLSAEALAAADAALTRKIDERQHTFGESWEQTMRLAAWIAGDDDSAGDFTAQVRWKDTESRSLAQAADALGKLATMLKVPVEVLWEKIPGWTDQDVEHAKAIAEGGDGLMAMLDKIAANGATAELPPPPAP